MNSFAHIHGSYKPSGVVQPSLSPKGVSTSSIWSVAVLMQKPRGRPGRSGLVWLHQVYTG